MADCAEPEIPQGAAESPTQATALDAAGSTPEISAPMLDVHAPHEPIHTWRNFLIHIAAIVVGLLIAVSLEQTVEFFHHRHQREQLEAALRRDGEANRGYIKDDIALAQGVLDWALQQVAVLERAGPTGPLALRHMPHGFIGSPDAGVWPSAKASGVTNLLPPSAQNWIEYLVEEYQETFVSSASASGQLYLAYGALDQAITGRAKENPSGEIDVSMLTPTERLTAVDCLHAIAERARTVMRRLLIYDAGNEYILSTPLDQLDTPEAGKRYSEIFKEKMDAHPAANFAFGGY
jgi:hypothetical protein